jgi:hypothetical protein
VLAHGHHKILDTVRKWAYSIINWKILDQATMKTCIKNLFAALALLSIFNLQLSTARAQSTAFMYQGQLVSGGLPANGSFDLTFSLFKTNATGGVIAGPLTNSATAVSNGLFTATLNYGSGIFNGTNYWLEIGVRTNGNGTFTTLAPRQPILPVPYALNVVTGAVSAAQLKTKTAPAAGQVLTWNGTNLYWSTPSSPIN